MLFFNVNRAEYTSFLINLLIVSTKKYNIQEFLITKPLNEE